MMKFKKIGLLLCLLTGVLLSFNVIAQQAFKVKGIVVDKDKLPLTGVSVYLKGTKNGITTDSNGAFELSVPSKTAILVFSYIGFEEQQHSADISGPISITLNEARQGLDEVVVMGYGTIRKKDLTGSVSSIKGSDLAAMPVSNPLAALGSRVPGLNISNNSGRPGGGFSATIRGINSINASNSPLFVVDGVIGAEFQSINPADIESIDILKDASATAIYGSQASNGVIIVTTKRAKAGDFTVSISSNAGVGTMARPLKMLDATQYMEYQKRSWEYDPKRGSFPTNQLGTLYPELFKADGSPMYDTDWQKESSRNAISNNTYLSITGGTEKAKQGLYLGLINDNGILKESFYKKHSIRYTTDINLKPWLAIGGSLSYNYNKKNQADDYGVGSMTATRLLAGMIPIAPVKFPDGRYSTMQDFGFGYNYDSNNDFLGFYKTGIYTANNPVQLLKDLLYNRTEHQFLGNFNANIKITKDLEFKTTFGTQFFDNNNQFYASRELLDIGKDVGGRASIDYSRTLYWQSENFLTYTKQLDVHRINAVLGSSWTGSTSEGFNAGSTGFSTDFFKYYNLSAGSVPGTPGSNYASQRMNSYYARVNYSLKDKYLLTVTGRTDGSSKFGSGNKYAFFPSVALGWNVSEEEFLKSAKAISSLKLRGSYGITGNSGISPYLSLGTLSNNTIVYLNGIRNVGTTMGNISNPDLKWERTAQLNTGADLAMFNNRLIITADVYEKKTTDLLLANPVSFVSGYGSVTENIGSVRNRGVEISVNGTVVESKDFSADLGIAFSTNRNKILALGQTDADILPGRVPGGLVYNVLRVGGAVGDLIGYKRIGTWGTNEAAEAAKYNRKPGDIKREDVNKDYVYDQKDVTLLGNIFPKYELYFNLGLRYKQFDLTATIQMRRGNKQVNASSFELEDRQYYLNSYASLIADAWTPQHQNTMVPAIRTQADAMYSDYPSGYIDSHFVEDGSFIRGKNLTLGYTFPELTLSKIKIRSLKVFANAQNFFMITDYRAYDPELSSVTAGSTFSQGVDYFGYPNARTYTLGLNLTF